MDEVFTDTKTLVSLKYKLQQLMDTFDDILNLSPLEYETTLNLITTTLTKYTSLLREVDKLYAIVHPHTLISSDPDYIPRILLRTKVLPEMEALMDATFYSTSSFIQERDRLKTESFLYQLENQVENLDRNTDAALERWVDSIESQTHEPLVKESKESMVELLRFMSLG